MVHTNSHHPYFPTMERTLLFIAGISGSAYLFPILGERLKERGWRLLLFEHCDLERRSTWASVDSLADEAFALLEQSGSGQVVLCGESFGGTVAQLLARRHPERISHLVLVGAFAWLPFRQRARLLRLLAPGLKLASPLFPRPVLRLAKRIYNPSVARSEPLALRLAVRHEPMPPLDCYVEKALLALDFDSRPWLSELTMPALVVAGEADRLIPPACSRLLARELPHAQLELIPRSGHLGHYGHPERFLTALDHLLARQVDEVGR